METVKILSGNRITLPKEFIDFWKLKEGDHLGFATTKEKVTIIPIEFKEKRVIK